MPSFFLNSPKCASVVGLSVLHFWVMLYGVLVSLGTLHYSPGQHAAAYNLVAELQGARLPALISLHGCAVTGDTPTPAVVLNCTIRGMRKVHAVLCSRCAHE